MSASYQPVLWNRQKKRYDIAIVTFVMLYLAVFTTITWFVNPTVTGETLIIRGTSTLAVLLLHIILAIGPLARLNPVFLPLLYNRRHLGVTMFGISAIHGIFSIIQFHALGNVNPILSVFTSNTHIESYAKFPFEIFGFLALVIFFLMAITSHDFWLHTLGPRVWKTLHMMVYVAYTFLVLHVVLGVIQFETSPVFTALLAAGMSTLIVLHVIAGRQERKKDESSSVDLLLSMIKVGPARDIRNNRAKVITVGKERVAIFKHNGKVSAVSNVCKHQNGPLGEGRIVDGCITCPWHGYQYLPENGCSPPPFKEKVATYDLQLIGNEIWINPHPNAEGAHGRSIKLPAELM